jgi:hypothetical protein
MGFHKSSMDIKLKEGHVLTAYCRRPPGEAIYSELDLDEFLGMKKGESRSVDIHELAAGQYTRFI